ncbi:hypothetical protein CXB51_019866 [Gossypium anomalum]|uniref:Uncharacterized protein n=1 Tax=Gossypium anomalum TaxID=47600 RepID=A0A8J5YU10_9ROSI|nr:hypothetical protein CXB51_019866 [Gossypium anomalum]
MIRVCFHILLMVLVMVVMDTLLVHTLHLLADIHLLERTPLKAIHQLATLLKEDTPLTAIHHLAILVHPIQGTVAWERCLQVVQQLPQLLWGLTTCLTVLTVLMVLMVLMGLVMVIMGSSNIMVVGSLSIMGGNSSTGSMGNLSTESMEAANSGSGSDSTARKSMEYWESKLI